MYIKYLHIVDFIKLGLYRNRIDKYKERLNKWAWLSLLLCFSIFSTKFYFKIGLKLYLFMQKNNVFIEQNLILKMGLKLYLCM